MEPRTPGVPAPAGLAIDVVMMAAGKGTRMKSAIPKVLQMLAHMPLAGHVLSTAQALHAR